MRLVVTRNGFRLLILRVEADDEDGFPQGGIGRARPDPRRIDDQAGFQAVSLGRLGGLAFAHRFSALLPFDT